MAIVDDNGTTSSIGDVYDVISRQIASTFGDHVTPSTSGDVGPDAVTTNIMTSLLNAAVDLANGTETADPARSRAISAGSTHAPTETTTSLAPATRSLPVPIHVLPTRQLEATFTGWMTKTENLSALHGNYNLYVLYATFGLMLLCFLLLVCWLQCKKRLMLLRYERLPVGVDDRETDFVYKPSNGDLLDEEYENTFVGVSIPILQDVTKL